MRSFPLSSPIGRVFRLCTLAPVLLVFLASMSAQRQLMVQCPSNPEKKAEVISLDESLCLVDLGYGVEGVAANAYFFEEAYSYAEGYLELNKPQGRILTGKKAARFDFSTTVKASRDYEDCFVVLRLYTQDGREFLLPYEIDDLRAGRPQKVHINPQLAFSDLDRGVYYYHFFSGGEEVYYAPTSIELGKKNNKPLALSRAGSCSPQVKNLPSGSVLESQVGLVSGEEALIALGVNDRGYSVGHVVLSESNSYVGKFAMNLVKKARFNPALENGYFVKSDLLLRVRFDSRGRFEFLEE